MNAYYQSDNLEHYENENENENEKNNQNNEYDQYDNMYYYENDNKKIKPCYSSLYVITHLILSFFAIYLSYRCAGSCFNPLHFIAALCCPHLYIIWALATQGGCGTFENSKILQK